MATTTAGPSTLHLASAAVIAPAAPLPIATHFPPPSTPERCSSVRWTSLTLASCPSTKTKAICQHFGQNLKSAGSHQVCQWSKRWQRQQQCLICFVVGFNLVGIITWKEYLIRIDGLKRCWWMLRCLWCLVELIVTGNTLLGPDQVAEHFEWTVCRMDSARESRLGAHFPTMIDFMKSLTLYWLEL